MYTKKQILLAIIISLLILILCVGGLTAGFFMYTSPITATPEQIDQVPVPASTEDVLSTYAATMVNGGAQAAQFNANVQTVIDTSAIPCLIVLIIVIGIIFFFEYRNRKKEDNGLGDF
ncbi:MAG: hypothetical protein JEZ00_03610 [Anaerolineaceae bacterium]|nr:hypothetical protein [Anaerolineaceae bacterium]